MNIKQISIFIENREGRLAEITELLDSEKINIRALSLADTSDFGVLRLIVNDPDKCLVILQKKGFISQETNVIAVEIEDRPGGLNKVLKILLQGKINVEYMYAFVEKKKENAIVIFKIDDFTKAIDILQKNKIPLVDSKSLQEL
jgi:hypothetical protein